MPFTNEDRAAFAASVPVRVEAADDGTWRVIDTATGEVISSEHASARAALGSEMAEGGKLAAFTKSANLRTDGEPDGAWRWLDATAVEDEPIVGEDGTPSRIAEQAIWEMAASLNARGSAVPINGGGAPEGLKDSAPHGDAYTGGDHPANGYAHVGAVVTDSAGRAHLYLFSELIAEVAAEVDRGRLAYGSVRFAFSEIDEADNFAALGAHLVSHALTNDPAVTTLTAGSERYRAPGRPNHVMRARRSRWTRQENPMPMTADQLRALHHTATSGNTALERFRAARALRNALSDRGAIGDLLTEAAGMFGLTADEVREDPWKLTDAAWALIDAMKIEEVLEANGVTPPAGDAPAPEPVALSADHKAAFHGFARRGYLFGQVAAKRAVEGMEGEALDTFATSMLDLGRMVLGKPDATPDDVVAELQAREEEILAALENAAEEPVEPDADDAAMEAAASGDLRARFVASERSRRTQKKLATERQARIDYFETRDWLDAELAKRGKTVTPEKRERWTKIAQKSRETALELIENLSVPPKANPLDALPEATGKEPKTLREAYDACMADAKAALDEEDATDAARRGRPVRSEAWPRHVLRSRAQRIAEERFPEICKPRATAPATTPVAR